MVIHFLRQDKRISILLAMLRVYVGYTWLVAGWGKIAGGKFDTSGFLQGAVDLGEPTGKTIQLYIEFLSPSIRLKRLWLEG